MLLSRLLADFTRGESDALRKAMGKKLRDKLDHMKPKFIEGGKKNGHDPKILEKIWADWENLLPTPSISRMLPAIRGLPIRLLT